MYDLPRHEGKVMPLLDAGSAWGDVPTWLGIVGGLLAFFWGLWQYRETRLWKRAEFVAAECDKFFRNPKIETALLLLDYSAIKLRADGKRPQAD
jgi:hypothetical protein